VKILCITKHFYPENFRINDFLFKLKKKGHQVTVFTNKPIYPYNYKYNYNSKFKTRMKGVNVYRIPVIYFGDNFFSKFSYILSFIINVSLVGLFLLIKKRFDTIFVFAPSPPTVVIPGIFLSKIKKIPCMMWLHDVWPESLDLLGYKKSNLIYILISKLMVKIYQNCHGIFTQSKSLKEHILKFKVNKNVFHLPVHAEATYLNLPKKNNNRKFKIYFFGNIGLAQDIPSVLKTIEILKNDKNIEWIFVGEGKMKNWLKEKIKQKKLDKNVTLKSMVQLNKVSLYYKDADALLISLKKDKCFNLILPAKVQSYLASGIPIFSMGNGETYSTTKSASCGIYCEAGNYKKFAKLIHNFKRLDFKKRKKIGYNGYKYYLKNFDISKVLKVFEDSTNKIINLN